MRGSTQQAGNYHRRTGKKAGMAILLAFLFIAQLFFGIIPGFGALTAYGEPGDTATTEYSLQGFTLRFNSDTGDLVGISFPQGGSMAFDAAYVDFCYDNGDGAWGGYMRDTLFYNNLDNLHTFALPSSINYNTQQEYPRRPPSGVAFVQGENDVKVTYSMPAYNGAEIVLAVETTYSVDNAGFVVMDSVLSNISGQKIVINGAATVVSGLGLNDGALFEMPGNIPAEVYSVAGLPQYYSVVGEYSSPLIHFFNGDTDINLIFANEYEKWAPSVTMGANGKVDVINLSCTIDELQPGDTLYLGEQFFQVAASGGAYAAAQNLYSANGWAAPTDGIKGLPIYSGHPAGVSDNDFADADGTLKAYQAKLDGIKSLGFDGLWLLPVFEHPDSGGSIYLPYNMEYIDKRYSEAVDKAGDIPLEEARTLAYDEMKAFGAAATAAGLEFMIDYVPHGPYRYGKNQVISEDNVYDNPWLTEQRKAWASKDRWNNMREEWDAYAFDFANQEYLDYMYELVKKQSTDFSMSGTRIDAVMGSLPTWTPYGDNRISQTGLYGGAVMTAAMREAIKDAGHTPLVLPENNNPTPYFAEYTDLFYDMPFHRVTLDSRQAHQTEAEFAAIVAHWLKTESASSTKGMQFGRFLENHDTVAPWYSNFDGERAVEVYGVNKARALWVLLSTVDGAPIIYQNDEIGNEEFFTDLLAMRKVQFTGADGVQNSMDIEYYNDANSGIIAYRRYAGNDQKLVLVNLLPEAQTRDFSNVDVGGVRFSTASPSIVYGDAEITGDDITLPSYGYVVINLTGGESFSAANTAQQFLVKNVSDELAAQDAMYREQAEQYVSFPIELPAFEPAEIDDDYVVFNPVDDYSDTTPDGPVWKYMYYSAQAGVVDFCETAEGDAYGVWRAYRNENGSFEWAGTGRSKSYYPDYDYFELDTNTGAEVYGLLVFVAPVDGTYLIPSFESVDVREGATSIVVVLKNGQHADKSPMMHGATGTNRMPAQVYDLNAGDTLTYYTTRMDGEYSFVELDRMRIILVGDEIEPADNAALLALIHEAELALLVPGYTAESAGTLRQAVDAAALVAGDETATEDDIEQALAALQAAIDGLAADKTGLGNFVGICEAVEETGYTPESFGAFTAALDVARAVIADGAATVAQVAAALDGLQAAFTGLQAEVIDATTLSNLVAYAKSLNGAAYTTESYDDLQLAIENAEAAVGGGDPVEIENAYTALAAAIDGLIKAIDTSVLEGMIAYAEGIDSGLYTVDSYAGLTTAIQTAKDVLETADADQAAIDTAADELRAAIASLEKKGAGPSKIDLLRQIGLAKAYLLVADKYTEETVDALKDALKAAQEIAEKEDATPEDVEDALAALVTAMEGRKEIDTGKPNPGPDPDPDPNPGPDPNPNPGPNPDPGPGPKPTPDPDPDPDPGKPGEGGGTGEKTVYKLLEGGQQTYKGSGDLTMRSEGDFSKFQKVLVDGKELTLNVDYIAEEGSTIITMLEGYLKTLADGAHNVEIRFEDGMTLLTFTVDGNASSSPAPGSTSGSGARDSALAQTGDGTNPVPFIVIAAIAVIALVCVVIIKRRRQNG